MRDGDYIDALEEGSLPIPPVVSRFVIPQHEIVGYFSDVRSKNEVLDGFLKFGNSCFSNLAVFSAFSNAIQFLKGAGDNIKKSIHIGSLNIDRNTILRRAVVSRFPYKGAIPIGSDEKVLFSKYFNRYAEEVFIYPGCIRGVDTDILFYADGFESERESSIATFEYLVEKSILSLKLLWVQKQLVTI